MLDFQKLYESYADDVFRFSLWLAGNSHEAEDITSETFVRAWSHNDKIRTETLKAYLFTIARNVYLEQRRNRKSHVALDDNHPDPAIGHDKLIELQIDLEKITSALQVLPETDRAAFILRAQHGLPYAEISRSLGLSLSSVKVKVHRVRKKLINMITDEEVYR